MRQLLRFGWVEAQCCLFAVLFFAGLAAVRLVPLPGDPADVLLLWCLAVTLGLWVVGWETGREVAVIAGGRERDMVVPGNGSTGNAVTLELRGLTRPLRPAEYVDLAFRFAENGTAEVLAPVYVTGETDRPVYTGERFEGGEEPALQAPAGGHHSEDEGE